MSRKSPSGARHADSPQRRAVSMNSALLRTPSNGCGERRGVDRWRDRYRPEEVGQRAGLRARRAADERSRRRFFRRQIVAGRCDRMRQRKHDVLVPRNRPVGCGVLVEGDGLNGRCSRGHYSGRN